MTSGKIYAMLVEYNTTHFILENPAKAYFNQRTISIHRHLFDAPHGHFLDLYRCFSELFFHA